MKPYLVLLMFLSPAVWAQNTLTDQAAQIAQQTSSEFSGDVRLACEALLCLSSGSRPGACSPALNRYFSIDGKHMISKRRSFLQLCPTANSSPEMQSLTEALVNGAGACDVNSLNQMRYFLEGNHEELQLKVAIRNNMPAYCNAFYANPIIAEGNPDKPVYVGTPATGGYWVSTQDYPAALADYNRQLEAYQKAQEARQKWERNNGN